MRRAVLAVAMAVAIVAPAASAPARPGGGGHPFAGAWRRLPRRPVARWAGGRVLVGFRSNVGRAQSAHVLGAMRARVDRRIRGFGIDVVSLGAGTSVPEAVTRLSASPLVAWAQPDWLVWPQEIIPDDDRFGEQWGLRNTGQVHPLADGPGGQTSARGASDADADVSNAWSTNRGKASTVLAIVDSGVDIDHPDIEANLWVNPGENDSGDGDGNGYAGDVHGWDFAERDATLLEDGNLPGADHGTHVAGLAAAADDGSGIVGACPGCRIMVLKFMRPINIDGDPAPDTMAGFQSAELEALAYARREGADILNASFGSLAWSMAERRAYQRLIRGGVLPVAAAGNFNGDNDMFLLLDYNGDGALDSASPAYPASYDLLGLVSVAASNHGDRYGYNTSCASAHGGPDWICTFTNWGHDSVDLAAPGVDITSTVPGGNYATFNGTSMAAPLVTGIAGLLKSHHPAWGPLKLRNALMNSVDRRESFKVLYALPGRRPRGGGFTRTNGRVNALRALLHGSPLLRYQRTDGTVTRAHKLRRRARGFLWWPRDVNDVYRKRLVAGRLYRAVLRGPRKRNFDLFGYKPGTKEIWQIEVACFTGGKSCKLRFARAGGGSLERARFRAHRGGVYFFQVSTFFARGKYSLKVVPVRR